MINLGSFVATAAAAAIYCASAVQAQNLVFAHLIIGNTASYTQDDALNDIKTAHDAGIDGFALNIAIQDGYTGTSLDNYYAAAEQVPGFKLFISFDYAASTNGYFDPNSVTTYINNYAQKPAQYLVDGKPFASTFEGPNYVGDWTNIKDATNAFFVPDYTSVDPATAANYEQVDGLLTWDAWPNGPTDTPTSDGAFSSALSSAGKTFMMSVSPWFYTNLPGKNWLWRGDNLWHLRWQQVMQYKPQLIEILTWNDWGESHYIAPNPPHDDAYPSGAADYNKPVVHSAWINDLPYYIGQYKNGGAAPAEGSYTPHLTFWYRLSPASACASTNTPCNAPYQSQTDGASCDLDEIYFTVFTGQQATVHISIGGQAQPDQTASSAGLYHGSIPFNGNLGAVTISASLSDGSTLGPVTGPEISNSCVAGWNAWVGGS
ncbi:hypothetical protein FH972_022512 [Carpinus fangiana]|uniref:GH26 domain-containing protein n=1 Tax=Carpinus fangiana TaxID=176857 RepID=A0A5N6KT07_9ROSI|nr:hypothetical protein FH972_022512 [Carpinus fangiana]